MCTNVQSCSPMAKVKWPYLCEICSNMQLIWYQMRTSTLVERLDMSLGQSNHIHLSNLWLNWETWKFVPICQPFGRHFEYFNVTKVKYLLFLNCNILALCLCIGSSITSDDTRSRSVWEIYIFSKKNGGKLVVYFLHMSCSCLLTEFYHDLLNN